MRMEEKMSSQILAHTNGRRPNLAGSALEALARPVIDGLSAFARRFMAALHESRQRQADRLIRRYGDLIDDSND
jgi:hypothetical protein